MEGGPSIFVPGGDYYEPLKPGQGIISDHLDLGLDDISDSSYDPEYEEQEISTPS
jgi:hypothetical protein